MRVDPLIVKEIVRSINIIDIIKDDVVINDKPNIKNEHMLCPFHKERTPSFCIIKPDNFYYCFGCGARGNVINWIMHKRRWSFIKTLRHLSNKSGISLK